MTVSLGAPRTWIMQEKKPRKSAEVGEKRKWVLENGSLLVMQGDVQKLYTHEIPNEADRKKWTEEYKRTNYSVIHSEVLDEINNVLYEQQVDLDSPWPNADGNSKYGRLSIRPNTEVEKVELDNEQGTSIHLVTNHTKQLRQKRQSTYDAVFLGTGFERQPSVFPFLKPLSRFFPLLDQSSKEKKQEMGFIDEEEVNEILNDLMDSGEDDAIERLRQRTRGITRDYRLVSYWSDAFTHPTVRSSGESGTSSPSRSSTSSSQSSGTTLASNGDGARNTFEPSIFFLGGNEQTHGLSDSLFSIVAHRAGELCDTIIKCHYTPSSLELQEIKNTLQAVPVTSLDKIPIKTLKEKMQTLRAA